MTADAVDLGHDHTLRWVAWAPDRGLNPQYDGLPDVERFGAIVTHPAPDGEPCQGFITVDSPTARQVTPGRAMWTVETWAPLTVAPSLLCGCGDHGWIRDGAWVAA